VFTDRSLTHMKCGIFKKGHARVNQLTCWKEVYNVIAVGRSCPGGGTSGMEGRLRASVCAGLSLSRAQWLVLVTAGARLSKNGDLTGNATSDESAGCRATARRSPFRACPSNDV